MIRNQVLLDAPVENVSILEQLMNDEGNRMGSETVVQASLVDSVNIDQVNYETSDEVDRVINWDSTNEKIIFHDSEFDYRYSDCEDSDSDETEYSDCCLSAPLTNPESQIDIVSAQLKTLLPDWALDNYITQTALTLT